MQSNQPWDDEPDAFDWRDPATGYPCAIRRNPDTGTLNGYVGVPDDHPFHGADMGAPIRPPKSWLERPTDIQDVGSLNLFSAILTMDDDWPKGTYPLSAVLHAHCGITYSDDHVPLSENSLASWWFGFDTGHGGDLKPGMLDMMDTIREMMDLPPELDRWLDKMETYRTFDYVEGVCTKLAVQLGELAEGFAIFRPDVARH